MPDNLATNLEQGFLSQIPATLAGMVALSNTANRLAIGWTGNLLSSPNVNGPYKPVTQTNNLVFAAGESRFWKAQIPVMLNSAQFQANAFQLGTCSDFEQHFEPGQGFLIYIPTPFPHTFVG